MTMHTAPIARAPPHLRVAGPAPDEQGPRALAAEAPWRTPARRGAEAFTRDSDDLAFSGGPELGRRADAFVASVGAIAIEEGFELNFHTTRLMRASQRQHLCGVVVNRRTSLPRAELERLEAILFRCVRDGPTGQNREAVPDFRAHLRGRVAWVEYLHPARGAKLRQLFEAIAWPEG